MIGNIIKFVKDRKFLVLFELVLVLFLFGIRMLNLTVSIDTDSFINSPNTTLNWLMIGRWGLVLSKKIFGTMWFNLYIASVMGYVCIVGYLLLGCYLFYYVSNGKKKYNYYLFSVLFLSHPVFVFQWFFKLQVFEVSFSMLLLVIADLMLFRWLKEGRKIEGILAVIPLVWSFGSYQSNVTMFIAMTIVCFLILGRGDFKEAVFDCAKMIGIFGAAFIINQVITSLFFSDSDYLNSYMAWGQIPVRACLENIKKHVGDVLLGRKIFSLAYALLLAGIFVMFLLELREMTLRRFFDYAAYGVLAIIPFALTIYSGAYENTMMAAARVQCPLAFILGSGYMLLIEQFRELKKKNYIKGLVLTVLFYIFGVIFSVQQLQCSLRLWYTDDVRYRQDCNFLHQIVDAMYDQGIDPNDKVSIAYIGMHQVPLNSSCFQPMELIGVSYFQMYAEAQPYYYISNMRISALADVEGAYRNYNITPEQVLKAREIAKDMPVWPQKGSIKEKDGIVVVKLSEDQFD